MTLRPELRRILDQLLARPDALLTLDAIAEAIGATSIAIDEIDLLLATLEAQGRVAEEQVGSVSAMLVTTLSSARKLRAVLGRAPSAEEIAADADVSVAAVKGALFFARILQR